MDVTVYTFEDEDGTEVSYHTFDAHDAEQTARTNGWAVVANTYEWADSEHLPEWDFTGRDAEDEDDAEDEIDPDLDEEIYNAAAAVQAWADERRAVRGV
jgi:hypothetical protein